MIGRLARTMVIAALVAAMPVFAADDYAAARAELVAAYQAEDFAAMVVAAEKALAARPRHPGATFNLALAHVLNGQPENSLDVLARLAGRGIDFGVGEMDEFATLRELPGWKNYQRAVEALHAPLGSADVALRIAEDRYIPEGIAVADDGSIFLGSIYRGELRRGNEVLSDRQGHWSVFGMRFDEDGSLWFASAAVPQLDGVGDELGRSGLFRLNVNSREITRTALLPDSEDEQVLGDLIVDGNSIYTTDSLTGAVYRYDIAADTFTVMVESGVLRSPQGLVLSESGAGLYVADYAEGLFYLSFADGQLDRLQVDEGITDYGVDGLYRFGDELIAIQNGIQPHRVVAFALGKDGRSITAARTLAANLPAFDEPTLGTVVGRDFYFVANSHWNRFDRENRLPDGLSGPIVLKIELAGR
jgi:sugar lactone lactonase YvrE